MDRSGANVLQCWKGVGRIHSCRTKAFLVNFEGGNEAFLAEAF